MADDDNKKDSNQEFDPSRRRFVKNTGMIVGGVAGGSLLGGLLTDQFQTEDDTTEEQDKTDTSRPYEARMFFTRFEDFVVLEQATERIFPEDDNGPGAIELGVPYFIDKQLAGPWGFNADDYRKGPFEEKPVTDHSSLTRGELFIKGLRKMNQLSHNRFDKTFDEAEEDEQMEILTDFDNGDVDMKGVSSASFFELLRMTVLEGAYADPLYGGNRDMKGWEMKEFPGAVSSYTNIIDDDDYQKMEPVSLTDYQQKS